jgi:hypothetical protein
MRENMVKKAVDCITENSISEIAKYSVASFIVASKPYMGYSERTAVVDAFRNRPDLEIIVENTEINKRAMARYLPTLVSEVRAGAPSAARAVPERLRELMRGRDIAIANSRDIFALREKGLFSKALDDMHEEVRSELVQFHRRDIGQIGDMKAAGITSLQNEIEQFGAGQTEPARSSRTNSAEPNDARSEMIKARESRTSIGRV